MSYSWPILSTVTFLPLLGALLIALLRGEDESSFRNARFIAMWTTIITFALSLILWRDFDPLTAQFQFVELRPWLGAITFHMGVDGISLPFVLLTTFLMPLCILASWVAISTRVKIPFSTGSNRRWFSASVPMTVTLPEAGFTATSMQMFIRPEA